MNHNSSLRDAFLHSKASPNLLNWRAFQHTLVQIVDPAKADRGEYLALQYLSDAVGAPQYTALVLLSFGD